MTEKHEPRQQWRKRDNGEQDRKQWIEGSPGKRERRKGGRERDTAEPALFPGDGFVYSLILTHGTWKSPYADSDTHHTAYNMHAFRNHTYKQSFDSRQLSQAAARETERTLRTSTSCHAHCWLTKLGVNRKHIIRNQVDWKMWVFWDRFSSAGRKS